MEASLFQPPMGDDLSIVNSARVSFANVSDWDYFTELSDGNPKINITTKTLKPADANLIQYLARGMPKKEWKAKVADIVDESLAGDWDKAEEIVSNLMNMAKHWVPFTHTAISLRMKAPIPIRVQCFKHKIGFTESEESRRYIKSEPEIYIPDYFSAAAANVKQGAAGPHPLSDQWRDGYILRAKSAVSYYLDMVNGGVAPEDARFVLPQGAMVNWIWTGNLASYARYYNQRVDAHAQRQSQELAKAVGDIIEPLFPVSWRALTNQ